MLRALSLLAFGAGTLITLPVAAQPAAEVTLTRIDCGTGAKPTVVAERFTDTFAYKTDLALTFTFSCYLVKHGDDYMVWDTGFAPGSNPNAPKTGLTDYLAQVKVTPEKVKYVGISHFHADHTGQLAPFAAATLFIGKGDWDGINATPPVQGANAAGFKDWMGGARKVEPLTGDKDVFGDGTVVILRTPGHTPGHSSLLVRLKEKGPVILMGDLAHFHENYDSNGVPSFNFDRAQTVASLERVKKIAANLKATIIIQHDLRDIGKLPAFPAAAK
jgi:glyoxylase-like metal-dependent hydrolase (beta-lactamase superfamily II)